MDNGDLSFTHHIASVCLMVMFGLCVLTIGRESKKIKKNINAQLDDLRSFSFQTTNFSELVYVEKED